jgi:hypothetical protein
MASAPLSKQSPEYEIPNGRVKYGVIIVSEVAMLQFPSELTPDAVEPALRRAAHRHDVSIQSVAHVGRHLHDSKPEEDALSFSICAPELYTALLAADIRISAFLPCRIAAFTQQSRTVLATVSPLEFCRLLNRPDLARLAAPLEDLLRALIEESAKPAPASAVTALNGIWPTRSMPALVTT